MRMEQIGVNISEHEIDCFRKSAKPMLFQSDMELTETTMYILLLFLL